MKRLTCMIVAATIIGCGGGGKSGSGSTPLLTTFAATSITPTGAILNGSVIPNGIQTRSWFEIGTDSALTTFTSSPKQDAGNGLISQAMSVTWDGLTAGTTYYFRFCAEDNKGFSKGKIIAFTTSNPGNPPTVATLSPTSVSATETTLNANVSSNGLATTVWFEWGTDRTLAVSIRTSPQSAGSGTTSQLVHAALTGLIAGTTKYYYRVAASNSGGTVKGDIGSFNLGMALPPSGQHPVSVHSSGRYLVDNTGLPFLLIGDSPQGMIAKLSLEDAELYFASRRSYGYNAVQIHLLAGPMFNGRPDFSTYDGITPFTTAGDISTPREAYFERVDNIVNLAAQHKMLVFLTAAETIDALTLFRNNGVTKCRAFGQYIGNRYKNYQNIIWNYGNDFQTWRTSDIDVILSVGDGIRDNAPNHLHTAWLDYLVSASRDSTAFDGRIQLDLVYSYFPTYAKTLDEYAKFPPKPIHLGEANYEEESQREYLTTPSILRKQNYWALTSGASGVFSVNGYMWNFRPNWKLHFDTAGTQQLAHLINLFRSIHWWELVPDSAHQVMTDGWGSYDPLGAINTNDFASVAMTTDNTVVIAYLPTSRTVTINMGMFSGGTVRASWYDPTNGKSSIIGTFVASGSRSFTPTSGDWVLVLLAAP